MSELATLTQRLRDAERQIEVVMDDRRQYQQAFTDSVTERWRLRVELEELRALCAQHRRGNDVY